MIRSQLSLVIESSLPPEGTLDEVRRARQQKAPRPNRDHLTLIPPLRRREPGRAAARRSGRPAGHALGASENFQPQSPPSLDGAGTRAAVLPLRHADGGAHFFDSDPDPDYPAAA